MCCDLKQSLHSECSRSSHTRWPTPVSRPALLPSLVSLSSLPQDRTTRICHSSLPHSITPNPQLLPNRPILSHQTNMAGTNTRFPGWIAATTTHQPTKPLASTQHKTIQITNAHAPQNETHETQHSQIPCITKLLKFNSIFVCSPGIAPRDIAGRPG